jgi:hypothetical protein
MIDQAAFPNTPAFWFWTSSPYDGSSSLHASYVYAWYVDFFAGYSDHYSDIDSLFRERCVR